MTNQVREAKDPDIPRDELSKTPEVKAERSYKFILRQRSITAAKRNPFNPRQRTKKGAWKTLQSFTDPMTAMTEYRRIATRGMYDRAVFWKGNRITNQYHFVDQFYQNRLKVNSVGESKEQTL